MATLLGADLGPIENITAGIDEWMHLPSDQENLVAALLAKDGGLRTRDYIQRNVIDAVRGLGSSVAPDQESILDAALSRDGGTRLKSYVRRNVLEPLDQTATPYRVALVTGLIFVGLSIVALIATLILIRRSELRKRGS